MKHVIGTMSFQDPFIFVLWYFLPVKKHIHCDPSVFITTDFTKNLHVTNTVSLVFKEWNSTGCLSCENTKSWLCSSNINRIFLSITNTPQHAIQLLMLSCYHIIKRIVNLPHQPSSNSKLYYTTKTFEYVSKIIFMTKLSW